MWKVKWHSFPSYLSNIYSLLEVVMFTVILRKWNTHDPDIMCGRCRSGFMTLPPVLLQEQPVVVLLLERALVTWSLAMDECGGHKDLRSSGRRSVIPYIHGRTELYWSSLPCLSLPCLSDLREEAPSRAFYSIRSDSYIGTRGPTGGPDMVKTLYNI
jgi:hypothetical protein